MKVLNKEIDAPKMKKEEYRFSMSFLSDGCVYAMLDRGVMICRVIYGGSLYPLGRVISELLSEDPHCENLNGFYVTDSIGLVYKGKALSAKGLYDQLHKVNEALCTAAYKAAGVIHYTESPAVYKATNDAAKELTNNRAIYFGTENAEYRFKISFVSKECSVSKKLDDFLSKRNAVECAEPYAIEYFGRDYDYEQFDARLHGFCVNKKRELIYKGSNLVEDDWSCLLGFVYDYLCSVARHADGVAKNEYVESAMVLKASNDINDVTESMLEKKVLILEEGIKPYLAQEDDLRKIVSEADGNVEYRFSIFFEENESTVSAALDLAMKWLKKEGVEGHYAFGNVHREICNLGQDDYFDGLFITEEKELMYKGKALKSNEVNGRLHAVYFRLWEIARHTPNWIDGQKPGIGFKAINDAAKEITDGKDICFPRQFTIECNEEEKHADGLRTITW